MRAAVTSLWVVNGKAVEFLVHLLAVTHRLHVFKSEWHVVNVQQSAKQRTNRVQNEI